MGEQLSKRSTWQLALGVGLLVGFLAVAVGLWVGADRLYEDNIAGFARAPVGCDTTLDFSRTGEFILYVETTGELDVVRGDCDVSGIYDRSGDLPAVPLVLRGPSGDVVELESSTGLDYDTGDFVGSSQRRAQIETSGDHLLTVGSVDGAEFVVSIGRNPDDGVGLIRWGSIGALIVGFLLGGFFLVLGSRRAVVQNAEPAPWQPTSRPVTEWPSGPPGFPVPPPTTGAAGVGSAPAVRQLESDVRPIAPPTIAPPIADPTDEQRSPWAPPGN